MLSQRDLTSLSMAKTARSYEPGEVIYAQGAECKGIYCIEGGLVGLRKHDADGHSTLVRLRGPGQIVGYRALLTGTDHQVAAEVLMPSRICFIPSACMRRLFADNPALYQGFLQTSLADLTEAENRYVHSVTHTARTRLLHLLLVLHGRFGKTLPSGGHVLVLPLSRQDLAALTGITPETLSRTVRRLESDGIARFRGRRVHFADVAGLVSEIDPSDGLFDLGPTGAVPVAPQIAVRRRALPKLAARAANGRT